MVSLAGAFVLATGSCFTGRGEAVPLSIALKGLFGVVEVEVSVRGPNIESSFFCVLVFSTSFVALGVVVVLGELPRWLVACASSFFLD